MDWQIYILNNKDFEKRQQYTDSPLSVEDLIKKEQKNNKKEPMANSYRLLKDTPDIKAGTIFNPVGVEDMLGNTKIIHYINDGCTIMTYTRGTVENNPDWFEKIVVDDRKYTYEQVMVAFEKAMQYRHHGITCHKTTFERYLKSI